MNDKGVVGTIIKSIVFLFMCGIYYAILVQYGYNIIAQMENGVWLKLIMDIIPVIIALGIMYAGYKNQFQPQNPYMGQGGF